MAAVIGGLILISPLEAEMPSAEALRTVPEITLWSPHFSLTEEVFREADLSFPWPEDERLAWFRWLNMEDLPPTLDASSRAILEKLDQLAAQPIETEIPRHRIQDLIDLLETAAGNEERPAWTRALAEFLQRHEVIRQQVGMARQEQVLIMQRRERLRSEAARETYDREQAARLAFLEREVHNGQQATGRLIDDWAHLLGKEFAERRWAVVLGVYRLMHHLYEQSELMQRPAYEAGAERARRSWEILGRKRTRQEELIRAIGREERLSALYLAQEIFFLERHNRAGRESRIPSSYRQNLRAWQDRLEHLASLWEEQRYETFLSTIEHAFREWEAFPPWKERVHLAEQLLRQGERAMDRLVRLHRQGAFDEGLLLMENTYRALPHHPRWESILEEWIFLLGRTRHAHEPDAGEWIRQWGSRPERLLHNFPHLLEPYQTWRTGSEKTPAQPLLDEEVVHIIRQMIARGLLWEAEQSLHDVPAPAREDERYGLLRRELDERIAFLTGQSIEAVRRNPLPE